MKVDSNKAEKTSKAEQAINQEVTQGKKINHQVDDKQSWTTPRDNLRD